MVAEFEDTELLRQCGQCAGGLFAASTVIEQHTIEHYRVEVIGSVETARIRFYAFSPEQRVTDPAVAAIIQTAHEQIFG